MRRRLRFHRLARQELWKAAEHYDEQVAGLGDRFLGEIGHTLRFILDFPEAAQVIRDTVRRAVLRTFPYSVLYRLRSSGEILVLAVAHQSQHPEYWVGRR